MLAHVSFVPTGTGEELKELLARAAKIIAGSELNYQLTSMGTIIEGDWDEIVTIIKKCHDEIGHSAERVVTNVVIDDRQGLDNRLKNNALEIEYAVGGELETNGLT